MFVFIYFLIFTIILIRKGQTQDLPLHSKLKNPIIASDLIISFGIYIISTKT